LLTLETLPENCSSLPATIEKVTSSRNDFQFANEKDINIVFSSKENYSLLPVIFSPISSI